MRLLAIVVGVLVLTAASQAWALGASPCADKSNQSSGLGPGPPRFENRLPGDHCLPGGTKVTHNGKPMCSYPTTMVTTIRARDDCYASLPLPMPEPSVLQVERPHDLCPDPKVVNREFRGRNIGMTDVKVSAATSGFRARDANPADAQPSCVWPNCRMVRITLTKDTPANGNVIRFALPSPGRTRDVSFSSPQTADCEMKCPSGQRLCRARTQQAFCASRGQSC